MCSCNASDGNPVDLSRVARIAAGPASTYRSHRQHGLNSELDVALSTCQPLSGASFQRSSGHGGTGLVLRAHVPTDDTYRNIQQQSPEIH
jgi:hypothetical protein